MTLLTLTTFAMRMMMTIQMVCSLQSDWSLLINPPQMRVTGGTIILTKMTSVWLVVIVTARTSYMMSIDTGRLIMVGTRVT